MFAKLHDRRIRVGVDVGPMEFKLNCTFSSRATSVNPFSPAYMYVSRHASVGPVCRRQLLCTING